MAHILGAEALHLEVPTKTVFDSVTIGVAEGDRIGIVGRNGDGKSSLLMMLAGRRKPDAGRVTMRGGTTIGVLDQADNFDEGAIVGHTIVGDQPEYEWAGDSRTRDVIEGLVSDLDWEAPLDSLSGGQRRRVALARLLVGDHELLFLDEPTNHLDVEGIAWLAEHLKRRWPRGQGALLVVTHDRWFLDEVCTATWEVHDRIVEPFEGGYAAYILQRVERDRQAATIEQKRQNLAKKELAWLRRGAPARTAKPKFRIEAANELIADVPEIRDRVSLQSMAVSRLGKEVVNLIEAGVTYGDRVVLEDIDWLLAPGERTGILGVNGAGKSTLLGLISGTVEPTSGRVKQGKTVKVATLTQRLDELEEHLKEPVRTVISRLRTSFTVGSGSKAQELTPGQLLERMGFTAAHLSTPVKDLSGGQKRRLQLLLILLSQPNVLILDEPTNDLDTDMLAAMEDLLDSWPGTLIVVSHDRYFLERVTDQQYAIFSHRLRHLPGGVDEYLKIRQQEERATDAPPATTAKATAKAAGTASAKSAPVVSTLSGAERRTAEKEVQSIERRMAKLETQIAAVHADMAAHDQGDLPGLAKLGEQLATLQQEVAEREETWLLLSEQLG